MTPTIRLTADIYKYIHFILDCLKFDLNENKTINQYQSDLIDENIAPTDMEVHTPRSRTDSSSSSIETIVLEEEETYIVCRCYKRV